MKSNAPAGSKMTDDILIVIVFSNQMVKVRQDDVQQMKRPKFYQASDIADHTFLNEAASRKTFTATMSAQGST